MRIVLFWLGMLPWIRGFLFKNPFWKPRHFDTEVTKTFSQIPPSVLHQNLYDMQWYVVGTPADFSYETPVKVTVWSKDYVVWKTGKTQYVALENACPHRGASFSDGTVESGCIVCPYHGYEYNGAGHLTRVPGIDLVNSCHSNQTKARAFDVTEEGGWVYLNTFPYSAYNMTHGSLRNNLYCEPEQLANFSRVQLEMDYLADPRLLTENGLDISHIGFVHSFGNRDDPCPINEDPPKWVGANRVSTKYQYKTGENSMAAKIFGSKLMEVENEFVLPHTSISRIRFASNNATNLTSTIITFATPLSANRTRLFVKNYRNFWRNWFGDKMIWYTMRETMNEDRRVVENIYDTEKNGRFNMRYDKLANTFRVFYEKWYNGNKN